MRGIDIPGTADIRIHSPRAVISMQTKTSTSATTPV